MQRDGQHYCLIHDPERVKSREKAQRERLDKEAALSAALRQQADARLAEAIRKQARWDFVERIYRDMKCGDAEMLLCLLGIPIPPDGPEKWSATLAQLVDQNTTLYPI